MKVALLEGKRVIKVANPGLYQLVYPQPILQRQSKKHVEGEKDTTHGLPGSDRFSGAGEKLADDDNDLKR